MTAIGFLEKYDNGIYYIPRFGGLLGKSYLDRTEVIMRKYVENKSDKYGYVTGLSFANQLGLTTQMPAMIEIVTNRESTNGRIITLGKSASEGKRVHPLLYQNLMENFYNCLTALVKLNAIRNLR